MSGKTHNFDSFECALHALAPSCAHCGVRIVGHGLGKNGTFYCCDRCAEAKGVSGLLILLLHKSEPDWSGTAWTSRQVLDQRENEPSAHGRNRIWNVPLGRSGGASVSAVAHVNALTRFRPAQT